MLRATLIRCFLLTATLVASFSARADTAMTQLNIEVNTESGRPIDRASVIVRFLEGRSIAKLGKHVRTTFELRTNQEGQARCPSIPQGKIRIQVIAKGYQTFGQVFEVNEEEKSIPITLNPPQQQYSAHDQVQQK